MTIRSMRMWRRPIPDKSRWSFVVGRSRWWLANPKLTPGKLNDRTSDQGRTTNDASPLKTMPKQIYDVIVIGTGAGGGMAIKTLCEAGLKVCAINAGRRLDPEKDFRYHRMPWDMKFRGLDDPNGAANRSATWTTSTPKRRGTMRFRSRLHRGRNGCGRDATQSGEKRISGT